MDFSILILAAGEGTRMKSKTPKVLQPVLNRPMISYLLDTSKLLDPKKIVIVVGHGQEKVKDVIGNHKVEITIQEKQRGTGDAVLSAKNNFREMSHPVVVLYGDSPFIKKETIERLVDNYTSEKSAISILTINVSDPTGYGRIVRSGDGRINRIIEEKDANVEQKEIKEVNTGCYCFEPNLLFGTLETLKPNNNQKEIYLTDVIEKAILANKKVVSIQTNDEMEIYGIDSRQKLARANAMMRDKINNSLMDDGITIIDPDTTWIGDDVKIGNDTTIMPNTFIREGTQIGADCEIGPNVIIKNSKIGKGCSVVNAVIIESIIEDDVSIGPFSYLRKGTYVKNNSKVGTFVETKNATINSNSKVPHLSYMGDVEIGENVNIGAGSITCNYDGVSKNKTVIEDGAFIGSDTLFVAPVKIGKGAVTGAGSVVRKDVSPKEVVAGVPAKHIKEKKSQKEGKNE